MNVTFSTCKSGNAFASGIRGRRKRGQRKKGIGDDEGVKLHDVPTTATTTRDRLQKSASRKKSGEIDLLLQV